MRLKDGINSLVVPGANDRDRRFFCFRDVMKSSDKMNDELGYESSWNERHDELKDH